MISKMSPNTKKLFDYASVLLALYFGAIGLNMILFIFLNNEEHVVFKIVDAARFNTEIGLIIFYLRNIPLRKNEHLQYSKALTLMFFWPLLLAKLQK